jgi:putative hydroxymethylpyrimidine transporter CytX
MPAKGDRLAGVFGRLEGAVAREASYSGIRPVPAGARKLSGTDLAVLWGDLSVGLLVILTGALLVPALGFGKAFLAIIIGSAIGCIPLALVGLAGAREGVPGMVLFRPVLGIRGSFIPSALNLVQLVGWTAVEFWAMASIANEVSKEIFHADAFLAWLVVVALCCTALAVSGPILVVRAWLERFGAYVIAGAGLWITYKLTSGGGLHAALTHHPAGGWPSFWLAVDLVIVMPVSWLPLVADYNRFAKPGARSFAGTYWGYFAGNVWFYSLGAMLVLAAGANAARGVSGIGIAVSTVTGGALLLIVLLVGETDEAFANIYSSAVSVQNVFPEAPQRILICAVSAVAFVLALLLSMEAYEVFLFLIGSVFVPLFGVFAADYFVLNRCSYEPEELFARSGRYWFSSGFRWIALLPWTAGFLVFQWCAPSGPDSWKNAIAGFFTRLHLPFPLFGSSFGASIPAFVVAFGLALVLMGRGSTPARSRKLPSSQKGAAP